MYRPGVIAVVLTAAFTTEWSVASTMDITTVITMDVTTLITIVITSVITVVNYTVNYGKPRLVVRGDHRGDEITTEF